MSTVLASRNPSSTEQPAMTIRVYNTLTKRKEVFQPVVAGQVGIYLCGPTVYAAAHIGHMVGPVIFDTIKRYLTYNGFQVTWVVNITDVDDKLIQQARKRNIPMSQVATEMTMDYCANLIELGVDQITHMPRATENMEEIISFIANLIELGFAYEAGGDVFFDVGRNPEYGKLSNRSADSQQGEGGEAAAKKRSSGDFALWKQAKTDEPAWDSPWGAGRPGWHIECSAMSRRILGRTFDIHGGGLDLLFPHHENEIAQSECCHGAPMAKYWMHNGLMRAGEAGKVGGRGDRAADDSASEADSSTAEAATQATSVAEATASKISRSAGDGGLRELIQRHGGERIRFFLLRTHYRSTIVFDEPGLEEAGTALEKFHLFFDRYQRITGEPFFLQRNNETRKLIDRREDGQLPANEGELLATVASLRESFLSKMDDDFNTGAAVSDLFQMLSALNRFADSQQLEQSDQRTDADVQQFARGVETLRELSAILGLFSQPQNKVSSGDDDQLVDSLMKLLIELRKDARSNKDFGTADRIRDEITSLGITLEDRKDGTGWRASP